MTKTYSASFVVFSLLVTPGIAAAQQYLITTVAGGASPPTGSAAATTPIGQPQGITADAFGNQYFVAANCVFKVDSSGLLTRVAGNSSQGSFGGDGGPATSAGLNQPKGLAVDALGNLYIGDVMNFRIRKVSVDGVISTVATSIDEGTNVAVDSIGNVYFDDVANHALYKLALNGTISTLVNNFSSSSWTVDGAGNVYCYLVPGWIIQKITANGNATTVAGDGVFGSTGDGGLATEAGLSIVTSLTVDSLGNLYIADLTSRSTPQAAVVTSSLIRKVGSNGVIQTIAGDGQPGFSGDGGPSLDAELGTVSAIATDAAGNLYLADNEYDRIRRVAQNGIVVTLAGTGGDAFYGDGGLGVEAGLSYPTAVALDSQGDLYIADLFNARVRKILPDGTIGTVAGNGIAGSSGDGGLATQAELKSPTGLAVDAAGNLYIADSSSNRVRKVAANGTITTIAGNGAAGFSGDGGQAASAELNNPQCVAVDIAGDLYILDNSNSRIRKVTPDGTITTVAGTGNFGFSGDGGPAAAAGFSFGDPGGLAVDTAGNLYVADAENDRVRKIGLDGTVSTVANSGFGNLNGITVDASGNIFVSDEGNVDQIGPDGTLTVIAGTDSEAVSGDGGLALDAEIGLPHGLAAAPNGTLYFADPYNNLVRALIPQNSPFLSVSITHSGNFYAGEVGGTYSIVMSNLGTSEQTTGAVSVALEIPKGITLVSAAGPGWACSNVCIRSDALNPNASYPPITLTINVSPFPPSQAIAAAIVSGGGAPLIRALDLANIYDASSPATPSLITPVDGSGGIQQTPALSWTSSHNTYYDVYLGTTPNPPLVATVGGPAYSPGPLSYGTAYYWKVVARNPTGSAASITGAFATNLKLQTISFAAIPAQTFGNVPITLQAEASQGGAITFLVVSGPAAISGNTLTLTGVGEVTVKASATAVNGYTAATAIQSFMVTSDAPVISAIVNAASYGAGPLTPGYLSTLFGLNLASDVAAATTLPLPLSLADTRISIVDGSGQSIAAQLLYVSPDQLNFVVPAGVNPGSGILTVTAGAAASSAVPILISETDPGLFSADATGVGAALGDILHVAPDGTVTQTAPLSSCSGTPVVCTSLPVVFDSPAEKIFLVFYGTGISQVSSIANVTVTIGNIPVGVAYAGAQGQFAGLDQVNVELPRSLVGVGQTALQLTVAGQTANLLEVLIQ